MPSPSPTSRRTSSSVASRNFPGCSRPDLFAPRGLHQNSYTSSNTSAASRALYESVDEHKENSTENGVSKGAPGRSNQNQNGPSKKQWVTHFSKPAATMSPSNRVLVDRNSSCSPVRPRSIASRSGETLNDKKIAIQATPSGAEEAFATPVSGKDVAELSKRIQQFLEDQELLLGGKTGSVPEVTSSSSLATPVEQGQRPSSSPYNPYNSPFSERPKFLRLNDYVSSVEGAATVFDSTTGADMSMVPPVEELPLFEGNKVLVTPLQQIQFRKSLSPSSNEDHEEVRLDEICKEQTFAADTAVKVSMDAPEESAPPTVKDEANCSHEEKKEDEGEQKGEFSEEGDESAAVQQALDQFQDQIWQVQDQLNVAEVEASCVTVNVSPSEASPVHQDLNQNLFTVMSKGDEAEITVDRDGMSLGKKALRILFTGALLVTFVTLVLLSSASPALLPRSLVDNPVNSFWQSSKYHKRSMSVMQGLDGLWSMDIIYIPADAHLAVLKGAELYQVISEQLKKARQELQLYVQVSYSIADDWGQILAQQLPFGANPDTARETEDRGRQFEWIQDYEFEKEWVDEVYKPVYTDWELLHEYDLGAANQFVFDSIPDSLKNDMWRNFSRLSDSPEVKNLLEDLMKLKGGSTEEDRLEVLQYFWEYTKFSASAHQSLMKFQVEKSVVEIDSKNQGLSTSSSDHDMEPRLENVDMHNGQAQHKIQFTDSDEHTEENFYQMPLDDDEQQQQLHLKKMGIQQEPIVSEMTEIALQDPHELMVNEYSANEFEAVLADSMHQLQSKVRNKDTDRIDIQVVQPTSDVTLDTAPDSLHDLMSEPGNEDISSTDGEVVQSTSDVKLGIAQLAILATFIVASFIILGRSRESKKAINLISHASKAQFLKKGDQPPNTLDDVHRNRQLHVIVKQDKKQVTMIEELSDSFASVLQSPEHNKSPMKSTHVRKDEDLVQSPIPTSATSPYGSFTTYKLMSKKEGQAVETKLTPVRRSSRIRNHVGMSPNANGVKRVAISPP